MTLEGLKNKLFKSKKFRDEYFKKDLAFEIGQMLLEARVEKGMTQKVLASRIGTKQPSIARIENGASLPSLSILEKIADAFGSYLIPPTFGFMKNYPNKEVYPTDNGVSASIWDTNMGMGEKSTISISKFISAQVKQESSVAY